MKAKLYKTEKENYVLVDPTKGTYDDGYMLGTSRESQYNKLSIKNCETIERGYDLGELAYEFSWNYQSDPNYGDTIHIFKEGFQKAIELMGDTKFSEDDMKEAYSRGFSQKGIKSFNLLVQSLQQTEWDVEIETQKYLEGYEMIGHQKGVYGSGNRIPIYNSKPKLDADGCLILKRID